MSSLAVLVAAMVATIRAARAVGGEEPRRTYAPRIPVETLEQWEAECAAAPKDPAYDLCATILARLRASRRINFGEACGSKSHAPRVPEEFLGKWEDELAKLDHKKGGQK
jgi:hypothetical protein